jgi:hypothetical protein
MLPLARIKTRIEKKYMAMLLSARFSSSSAFEVLDATIVDCVVLEQKPGRPCTPSSLWFLPELTFVTQGCTKEGKDNM